MTKHGTSISWTHVPGYKGETWNPTVGCTRVSPGCDNCYAFTLHDKRYADNKRLRERMLGEPTDGDHRFMWPQQYDRPFSQVQLLEERLEQPLHWRKPRAVFVDSMSDLFHEDVPDDFIERVWRVMNEAHTKYGHIFMVLTKRPERMRKVLGPRGFGWYAVEGDVSRPEPGIWLGVSVEDQPLADERIPLLLDTPAAVRFVSAEPLLGPVDFGSPGDPTLNRYLWLGKGYESRRGLDWIIVGGESGPRARWMDIEWARSIRDQCAAEGVPFFYKQGSDGARPGMAAELDGREHHGWPVAVAAPVV